ncbi:hypothetical protein [Streptomyces sp. NPDC029003]
MEQDTLSQELEPCAADHPALEHPDAVHMAFDDNFPRALAQLL